MDNYFPLFIHSLLRYGVLITVAAAGLIHLRGLLAQRPILNGERSLAIVAVVLCHVQLVVGLILYAMSYELYSNMQGAAGRFWKMEHLGTMVVAILLVTLGRALSKRAKLERSKQLRIAVFFLIGLALMLLAIPWPFTEIGHNRGWL